MKFIRLEDYLEDKAVSGEMIALEPQGYLFVEVTLLFAFKTVGRFIFFIFFWKNIGRVNTFVKVKKYCLLKQLIKVY